MEAKMLNCSLNAIQRRKKERKVYEKQNFIIQIKLAQKESCTRLAKAQKFQAEKIIFFSSESKPPFVDYTSIKLSNWNKTKRTCKL